MHASKCNSSFNTVSLQQDILTKVLQNVSGKFTHGGCVSVN